MRHTSPTVRSRCLRTLALALVLAVAVLGSASAEEHIVLIQNNAFVPAHLDVQVGDTVTWVNDGGLHNVTASDDSFTSGAPSTDLWRFSHTFHAGDMVMSYGCEATPSMAGTVGVTGIFGDDFETGGPETWSQIEPTRIDCNCYFSADCPSGQFCNYGPGGFTTEDICTWVDIKPDGTPGAGCSIPHVGPWGGDICDGICDAGTRGSSVGFEDVALVQRGVRLWSEAMLRPALTGGGPLDAELAEAAMNLPFQSDLNHLQLGRQVADTLMLSGTPGFYAYFCDHEQNANNPDPDKFVDLSEDVCGAAAARMLTEALIAELGATGSGAAHLADLPKVCVNAHARFAPRCADGSATDDVVACVAQRIEETAVFLNTPRYRPNPTVGAFVAPFGASGEAQRTSTPADPLALPNR
ncbi:MAG: hypothetical protein AAF772_10970 [Acidobacteriota bacterium]